MKVAIESFLPMTGFLCKAIVDGEERMVIRLAACVPGDEGFLLLETDYNSVKANAPLTLTQRGAPELFVFDTHMIEALGSFSLQKLRKLKEEHSNPSFDGIEGALEKVLKMMKENLP